MLQLNLPNYDFKINFDNGYKQIFDPVRKKMVTLNDEEWVRQHLIRFLSEEKNFPISLMAVEKGLKINNLKKRFDILCYGKNGCPILLIECKSPSVKISQSTFDQISTYNINLKVPYLLVSNGLNHYCCKMDYKKSAYLFLDDIPDYTDLDL